MATPTTNYNLLKPTVGETYNVQTLNDNYDKIDTAIHNVDAARANQALGLLAKKRVPNSGAAPGTTMIIVDNFASVSLKAGRHYRVTWAINSYNSATAQTYCQLTINLANVGDAASATTGLTLSEVNTIANLQANSGQSHTMHGYIDPVSDTTIQIKFAAQTVINTVMNLTNYTISVEDLGLQF